jgi:putative NADH-flavin reductase
MESIKKFKIGIFGGSQGVGKECIKQALREGHKIITLARDPKKLDDLSIYNSINENLKIIQGDVFDQSKVDLVISQCDIVINSLGGPGNVCSKGTEQIIFSMKRFNIKRIITCSSLGVGDSYREVGCFTRFIICLFIKKPIADKNIQEDLLNNSGLDYITVRPGHLINADSVGTFKTENVTGGKIPRCDVATFILKQISSDEYLKRSVSLVSN